MKYFGDMKHRNLVRKYYSIWLSAQCCTFGLVPEHLRIPFIAMISFFLLIVLSQVSSSDNVVDDINVSRIERNKR